MVKDFDIVIVTLEFLKRSRNSKESVYMRHIAVNKVKYFQIPRKMVKITTDKLNYRRVSLFFSLLLFIGFLSCGKSQNQVNNTSRLNIIFLLADDQRDNTFGAMGNFFIKTPNVDKLIRQGIRFSNTYIAEPVCSPSRTSLLTGMHERMNGDGFSFSY